MSCEVNPSGWVSSSSDRSTSPSTRPPAGWVTSPAIALSVVGRDVFAAGRRVDGLSEGAEEVTSRSGNDAGHPTILPCWYDGPRVYTREGPGAAESRWAGYIPWQPGRSRSCTMRQMRWLWIAYFGVETIGTENAAKDDLARGWGACRPSGAPRPYACPASDVGDSSAGWCNGRPESTGSRSGVQRGAGALRPGPAGIPRRAVRGPRHHH